MNILPEIFFGYRVTSLTEGDYIFNRYSLVKLISIGNSSIVWKAFDNFSQTHVALKFIPEKVAIEQDSFNELQKTIKLLSAFKIPQVPTIHRIEKDNELSAIVFQFVEGVSLHQLRFEKSNFVFEPSELLPLISKICAVLDKAHSISHLPHSLLKPTNVIISPDNSIWLTDFAIGRVLSERVNLLEGGADVTEIFKYSSPQQIKTQISVVSDDIYAIGVLLYELLTGRPPFEDGDIIQQVMNSTPLSVIKQRKELKIVGEPIPLIWDETICSCLSKNPDTRPQTVLQVIEQLSKAPLPEKIKNEEVVAESVEKLKSEIAQPEPVLTAVQQPQQIEQQIPAQPPEPIIEELPQPKKYPRKNRAIIYAIAVLIILVIGSFIFIPRKKPDSKEPPEQISSIPKPQSVQPSQKEATIAKAPQQKPPKTAIEQTTAAPAKPTPEEIVKMQELVEKQRLAEEARKAAELARLKQEEENRRKAEEAKRLAEIEKAKQQEAIRLAEEKKRIEDEAKKAAELARLKQEEEARKAAELAKLKQEEEAKRRAQEEAIKLAEIENARQEELKHKQEEAQKIAEEKQRLSEEAKKIELAKATDVSKRPIPVTDLSALVKLKPPEQGKIWINSLGIRFVPIQQNHFAVWECRVQDFAKFVDATGYNAGTDWKNPQFKQQPNHPVINVNWNDAQAFCKWLTEKEKEEGIILPKQSYRLPTDEEWSIMVGLPSKAGSPIRFNNEIKDVFPWGNTLPMPPGAGNYANNISFDRFEYTSPVGSFPPNPKGVYDLGGNVWEWLQDIADSAKKLGIIRGGSYTSAELYFINSSCRLTKHIEERSLDTGFRIVLESK